MKSLVNYIFIISTLFFYFFCQPAPFVKKEQKKTGIDSTLYFRQVDVDDPFLDTVFQGPDTQIVLQKTLIPAEKPPERQVRQVEGFRVQIFAGIDSMNALVTLAESEMVFADTVYFFKEKGLYKLQTGDYLYRPQADSVRDLSRNNGYSGAWVVKRLINLYDQPPEPEATNETITDSTIIDEGRYKIQVVATSSQSGAEQIVGELKESIPYRVYYLQSGSLYKIFIGNFQDETTARRILKEVRETGYPDAWLVY